MIVVDLFCKASPLERKIDPLSSTLLTVNAIEIEGTEETTTSLLKNK